MSEDNLCDFCQINIASLKCFDCKIVKLLCNECYHIRHKHHKFKNHRTESHYKEMNLCYKHRGKELQFICKNCGIPACMECKEDVVHRNHEFLQLNIDQNKIKEFINIELEKFNKLLEQNEAVKINQQKSLLDTYKSLIDLKQGVSDFFSNLLNFIKQKKSEVMKTISKYELKYSQLSLSLKKKHKLLKMDIHRKANLFANLKEKDACNIHVWKNIYSEEKKSGNCQNKAKEMERASNFLDQECKNLQKFSKDKNVPKIEIINKIIEDGMQKIINLNLNVERLLIIGPIIDKANPNRKIIKISENPEWKNKIVQKATDSYCSIFYDFVSKKYYHRRDYHNRNSKLYENSTTDDLFSNQNSKEITLNAEIDGSYYIANNGYLIYSIENSTKIGKANLSNGNQEEELNLDNAGFRNTFPFNWAGYTDIALFSDAQTETIFVMYQLKNENTATLNELICFPKLQLGKKSWKLPFAKKSIGFCMINDYILYIGTQCYVYKFNQIYNLVDNSYEHNFDLNFRSSDNVSQISYIPQDNTLIIANAYSLFRSFAEYK